MTITIEQHQKDKEEIEDMFVDLNQAIVKLTARVNELESWQDGSK